MPSDGGGDVGSCFTLMRGPWSTLRCPYCPIPVLSPLSLYPHTCSQAIYYLSLPGFTNDVVSFLPLPFAFFVSFVSELYLCTLMHEPKFICLGGHFPPGCVVSHCVNRAQFKYSLHVQHFLLGSVCTLTVTAVMGHEMASTFCF